MRKKPADQVVAEKREWHYKPSAEEQAQGFKGWYSRGYLPHFDAPGTWQFITYRLAASIPAELRHEWAEAMKVEDARGKIKRMELMLGSRRGAGPSRAGRLAGMARGQLGVCHG